MINKPNVEDLLKEAENRFSLVNMVAKRARQLEEGQTPMLDVKDNISSVTIAAIEIEHGKLKKENIQE